jgi:hypothetical protein
MKPGNSLPLLTGITAGITAGITLFLLYSCMTTSIADMDIQDVEAMLVSGTGQSVTSVIPGRTYKLKVTITGREGRIIKDPFPGDLLLNSTDTTFINFEKTLFDIYITSTMKTLVFTRSPEFSLTIKVRNNPYYKRVSWPVNWEGFTTLDFSGAPGENGLDGLDGSDGSSSYGVADGSDGSDGWDGGDGKKGMDATVLVLYYSVDGMDIKGIRDNTMLFLADITHKSEYLLKKGNVIIDASGGNGGDGGKGGDAGEGTEYTENNDDMMFTRKKGKDGEPGTGGSGGNGGDGGSIQLLYVQDHITDYITVVTNGGNGGKAGENGETADFSVWHRGIKFDGNPGKDGQFTGKKITAEQARAICAFIDTIYFEPGRIRLE